MKPIQSISPIRFFYGNLENVVIDPFSDPVIARRGDVIRTLINKFEIGTDTYSSLRPCLLPLDEKEVTPMVDRVPVLESIGSIRRQTAEDYIHFRIKVNGFKKGVYRQFSLNVQDSNPIILPFGYDGDSLDELMSNLAQHIEMQPNTLARTKVNGSIIDVYMLRTSRFDIASNLNVILGDVSQTNLNNPSMRSNYIETYTKGSNKDYQMVVLGTVIEGNSFTYDGATYIAKKGDTGDTIVNIFTGGQVFNRLDTDTPAMAFLPGERKTINSNIPFIVRVLNNTSGGNDHYRVELSGTYNPGNILTVFTSSRSVTYTVQPGDSIAVMESFLNPDAGFFSVPSGTAVEVRSASGTQVIANDNLVQFYLDPVQTYGAEDRQRYGVVVGSDVVKGNRFLISDPAIDFEKLVVAKSTDTNLTIAPQFSGQQGAYFIYERPDLPDPVEFIAVPGYRYTEEDIMDVSIISQPTSFKPNQAILEMIIPDDAPIGRYALALRDIDTGVVVSISSVIHIDLHSQTSVVESSEESVAYGFDYMEVGLVQRIRVPLAVRVSEPQVEEKTATDVNGEVVPINTKIDYVSNFSTLTMENSLGRSLVAMLKNSFVRIDGQRVRASAIGARALDQRTKRVEISGTFTMLDQRVDNYQRNIYPRIFESPGANISAEYSFGLRLFLRNPTFTKEVIGQTSIPADGYFLEVVSEAPTKGFVKILVRDQLDVLVEMEVDKEHKHRSIPFRIQPGASAKIEVVEVSSISTEGFEPVESVEFEVIYTPEITLLDGDAFDDGFDAGYA